MSSSCDYVDVVLLTCVVEAEVLKWTQMWTWRRPKIDSKVHERNCCLKEKGGEGG